MARSCRKSRRLGALNRAVSLVLAAACALLLGASVRASEVRYSVTDLGSLGGDFSGSGSINNKGQIAVTSRTTPGSERRRVFIWQGGAIIDVLELGYDNTASGINEHGHVAGYYYADPGYRSRGYIYKNGQFTDLGTLGGDYATADAINIHGEVTGDTAPSVGPAPRAYLYTNEQMIDLATPPFTTGKGLGINDHGQVVGYAHTAQGARPFLYENGTMIDLAGPDGDVGYAYAINNQGHAVGFTNPDGGSQHAAMFRDGQVIDLHTVAGGNSSAEDINVRGQVVGHLRHGLDPFRAFLYEHGTMYDLNALVPPDSGWALRMAGGINDHGWIVGYGINPQGQTRAFLLRPIPEPGNIGAFFAAAIATLQRRHLISPLQGANPRSQE